jgi:hypothetical protein
MRKNKTKNNKTTPAKKDAFVSVARRLECDEDKERFEKKLGKIAKAKPQPSK